jgi:hypothetical protein
MRRGDRATAFAAGLATATLLVSSAAGAYCRTASCDPNGAAHSGAVCVPPTPSDCGTPIAWPQSCIEYSVQQDGSPKLGITFAQTEQVMATAFGTWMAAACPGGGHPDIQVTEGPPVTCDMHEYNQMAGNANIILFRDAIWPYEGSSNTLALTTITYSLDTGAIYDADMELNSADNHFTIGDTSVDFDLLSIVTHESGHFLGMAHSHDPTATMWPVYNEHTTNLRHLAADDTAGICAAYPPGPPTPNCDPTPRHGFSACCAAQQAECTAHDGGVPDGGVPDAGILPGDAVIHQGCCSVAPGSDAPDGCPAGVLLGALGATLLAARRRRRS